MKAETHTAQTQELCPDCGLNAWWCWWWRQHSHPCGAVD